jgi:DNA-binding response OmpR family regulator
MKRTILLIEDDEMIATMLSAAIRSWGYEALHASGSQEALKIANGCQDGIFLAICDVVLRDGNGPAVAAGVRTRCPKSLTLFTSGYPLDILMERGLLTAETLSSTGAEYLQKPFLPRDLRAIVDGAMRSIDETKVFSAGVSQ